MSDYETTADLNEAIHYERMDADMLQAQYVAESNRYWNRMKRAKQAFLAGDLVAAADLCDHSGGYPLDSLAAQYADDPGQGQAGYRCTDCGSRLDASPFDDRDAKVTVACELGMGAFMDAADQVAQ